VGYIRHLLNGLFSRTTRESWHQKDDTNQDFHEERGDEVAVASAGPRASYLCLAPDRR